MKAEQLKTIREAIDAFDRVVAMTYDPNDHDAPHPDHSAADVFEAVCNLHTHVYEAYRAITTVKPKESKPTKIVVSCTGGVVTAVYCTDENATAEVVDFDEFDGEEADPEDKLDEATCDMACIY